MAEKITNRWKHHKTALLKREGNVKETPGNREAFVHPQEWRRSSREVGETPENGEESQTFGEEP